MSAPADIRVRPIVRTKVEPRGLRRSDAASYVGISPALFDQMVKDGRMPKPKRINTVAVWDRSLLDEAFDALPDGVASDGWGDVK